MRFYKIIITDQDGKMISTPSSVPGSGATYTSFANNRSIPGALQIELDIPLGPYATPLGAALIRIWGISLAEISQATQLNPKFVDDQPTTYKNLAIYGGMQKGLPLATAVAGQAGLLVEGTILQAFGNWIGNEMTLDLIVTPYFGTNTAPKNIVFDWKANTPLKDALAQTLSTAFPKLKQSITISSDVVLNSDEKGFYYTLEQFAAYIKEVSVGIIGGSYVGVNIFLRDGTFIVTDHTTATTPIKVYFADLIGQPTWIGGGSSGNNPVIQFKCVMRGDISIGDYVQLPPAIVTTTSSASSSLINLKSAFEGTFYVTEMRHVGNFRQPDAASWITTFNAAPQSEAMAA